MTTGARLFVSLVVVMVVAVASVFGLRTLWGPEAGWGAPLFTMPVGALLGWWIAGPE